MTIDFTKIFNKPNPVIFDIGACDYIDSLILKQHFPQAVIYAFEADPENVEEHGAKAINTGIKVVKPMALSDENSNIIFYPSEHANGKKWKYSGSILKPIVKSGTSEAINNPGFIFNLEGKSIESMRLDTFCQINNIQEIDYIHMDVQGAETKVLSALGNLRPKFIFAETCEFDSYETNTNLKDFDKFMLDLGYKIKDRSNTDTLYGYEPEIKQSNLVIANMYRAKNKSAFFAIHQAINKLPEFDIEFHILWDDTEYRDEWSDRIDSLNCKIIYYSKEMLNSYCKEYGIPQNYIDRFQDYKAIYFIIHAHYLKSKNITDYYLIYDDDIILQDELSEFKYCLKNKIPCLISEPLNAGCDKSLAKILFDLYENSFQYYQQCNPNLLGFNAGIQGISLDMYEDFLDLDYFLFLLNLFNYNGIYDTNGKEITGPERSAIDTQQQSFFGIMNIIRSKTKPEILNPVEYFICPNWGYHPVYGNIDSENEYGGWDINMKSKIIHFIGHTVLEGVYYGKPKMYHELVDKYLKENNLI